MSVFEYIDEKLGVLILNLSAAAGLSAYLFLLGLDLSAVALIWIVWLLILLGAGGLNYAQLSGKYHRMKGQLAGLDQKYLIAELIPKPHCMQEKIYYQMLRTASKSMLEEIGQAKSDFREYKEYIEEWIHEIKTPILAIELLCKNHPSPATKKINAELFHIRCLVEQSLYYARSGQVENDYFIREFPICDAVGAALMDYRTQLLEEGIQVFTDERTDTAYTDEKWVTFIVGQLISNAVKYHSDGHPQLRFSLRETKQAVFLEVWDNGKGISPEDLPRIFEKSFTGNDRKNTNSTGMGLYLCRKLCIKLGLSIQADSEADKYTRITLGFPKGRMHRPEDV